MPPRLTRRPAVRPVASSKLPDALPARLFLLAYDPATGRLASRSRLGQMLRAAALIDLQLSGHLGDDDDRAQVKVQRGRPHDPIAASMLDDISASSPRKWRYWIDRHHRGILREVRDELERARLIKVEPHRRFGLFPAERITLRQPLVRRQLLQAATDTLRPARLVTRIDLRDAALVVLAATGDLRTVVSKDQRDRHKDRLAQLAVRVGPVVPALRKSVQASAAAAAGGG
ncbi:MAG TPA: GPP34 family phosphoprotein [Kribbella sp.]|uniref:GOLPH3/VPS74 family protein n=1 Tax=Kribbella sp. TaxID=1871183 RepID=UPI002D791EDD|nr:GPP34 family phosphoprotein [Kribbella sp.]HET6297874.1 GPP34 family phosphoprotein [Kribbella sp.]